MGEKSNMGGIKMAKFDINQSINAQAKLCEKKNYPHFAPKSGVCWCCNQNIYEQIGWKRDELGRKIRVDLEKADFKTGISTEKAGKELITGCPHCNRTYCD
ncbi:hypothetical protein BS101_21910 (plasmid) [Clostridium kluyveri]|uniref:Uncharacterized protein n=2 Tax=Clostridium kluyveri TaxID=1534 RepID=A0A1L5FED0_CLOKL|nr:hypothetical protein BS101_21910 [Clostridium kluyveri]